MLAVRTLGLVMTGSLAACATTDTASHYHSNVDCIHDVSVNQHQSFALAVNVCGRPVPDLTGDGLLQVEAIWFGYTFTVDRARDRALKFARRRDVILTGSRFPAILEIGPDKGGAR